MTLPEASRTLIVKIESTQVDSAFNIMKYLIDGIDGLDSWTAKTTGVHLRVVERMPSANCQGLAKKGNKHHPKWWRNSGCIACISVDFFDFLTAHDFIGGFGVTFKTSGVSTLNQLHQRKQAPSPQVCRHIICCRMKNPCPNPLLIATRPE